MHSAAFSGANTQESSAADEAGPADDDVLRKPSQKSLAQYSGLAIKIHQNGRPDAMMIQQLSGGERSVVSLHAG